MAYLVIIFLGLIVGSYLGCLVFRLPNKENSIRGRSGCPACRHKLGWLDLIPVFSFVFLRGRCRYCQSKIWMGYLMIELTTALVFLLSWIFSRAWTLESFIYLTAILSVLVLIAFIDLFYFLILDKVLIAGFAISILGRLLINSASINSICSSINCSWSQALWGLIFMSGIFALLFFISAGKWIGFGDVKLGAWVGFVFGFPKIINVFYLAFFAGAVAAIILLLLKKANRKTPLPLGTFIAIASIFYVFLPLNLIPASF